MKIYDALVSNINEITQQIKANIDSYQKLEQSENAYLCYLYKAENKNEIINLLKDTFENPFDDNYFYTTKVGEEEMLYTCLPKTCQLQLIDSYTLNKEDETIELTTKTEISNFKVKKIEGKAKLERAEIFCKYEEKTIEE